MGRVCQTCGGHPAALLRGFNGAKDMALCPACRTDRLHQLTRSQEQDAFPREGPCWMLAGRLYVPTPQSLRPRGPGR